jgi:translation initiation factor eIF-2B subunit delta
MSSESADISQSAIEAGKKPQQQKGEKKPPKHPQQQKKGQQQNTDDSDKNSQKKGNLKAGAEGNAAKAGNPAGAKPGGNPSSSRQGGGAGVNTPTARQGSGATRAPRPPRLALFDHLSKPRAIPKSTTIEAPASIHPAIIKLGELFLAETIYDDDDRAQALLIAFCNVVEDYKTPPHTSLSWDLDKHIKLQVFSPCSLSSHFLKPIFVIINVVSLYSGAASGLQ